MLYYKGLGIKYDELSQDFELLFDDKIALVERFSSLSYVYDYIDSLELA